MAAITISERARIELDELQDLFRRAWGGGDKANYERVLERAFTWITARDGDRLVGFINVAWDGGAHFFVLDTTVDPEHQRQGIGTALVRAAIEACRGHGDWIHVDADQELMEKLYLPAGFAPADAGVAKLVP